MYFNVSTTYNYHILYHRELKHSSGKIVHQPKFYDLIPKFLNSNIFYERNLPLDKVYE